MSYTGYMERAIKLFGVPTHTEIIMYECIFMCVACDVGPAAFRVGIWAYCVFLDLKFICPVLMNTCSSHSLVETNGIPYHTIAKWPLPVYKLFLSNIKLIL